MAKEISADSSNYVALVLETESMDWGAIQDRLKQPMLLAEVKAVLLEITLLGQRVDVLKRAVFYDKYEGPLRLSDGMRADPDKDPSLGRMLQIPVIRFLHSIAGLQTETGELAEWLLPFLAEGADIDWEKVSKEYGDLSWYHGVGVDVQRTATGKDLETIMTDNIRKLRKRYPKGSFTPQDAVARADDQEDHFDSREN